MLKNNSQNKDVCESSGEGADNYKNAAISRPRKRKSTMGNFQQVQ